MKYLRITTILVVLATFISIGAVRARTWIQTAKFLGKNGWTLTQERIVISDGGQPEKLGREVYYFAANGERRHKSFKITDGKTTCTQVKIFLPDVGILLQDLHNERLSFLSENGKSPTSDVNVGSLNQADGYSWDEEILGYKCSVTRNIQSDGSIDEYYWAQQLGGFPIKMVTRTPEYTEVYEPVSIKLGSPPRAEMNYRSEWKVDYSDYEQRIKAMESKDAQRADYMKGVLNRAKQKATQTAQDEH